MPRDPRTRFTDRVAAYIRFRPSYPQEMLDLLQSRCHLDASSVIADIGSGTGILSRLFLQRGYTVYGVEPNGAMRTAAEGLLAEFDTFTSVEATAEATCLADDSVQLITSAQAFHWFHPGKSRLEFARILQPEGWVAIIWNDRRKTTTPFLRAYENLLLRHGIDYERVDHTRVTREELAAFFGPAGFSTERFDNRQILDYAGLKGRLESSSYTPAVGTPGHDSMIEALQLVFDTHESTGTVSLDYDTLVYSGHLS